MARSRKTRRTSKTKRVTRKRKKNEPRFHFTWKVSILLSVIVAFMLAMVFLSSWRTEKRALDIELAKTRHEKQVDINKITYRNEQALRELEQDKAKYEAEIDELKLQIEMIKGEKKVLNASQ